MEELCFSKLADEKYFCLSWKILYRYWSKTEIEKLGCPEEE